MPSDFSAVLDTGQDTVEVKVLAEVQALAVVCARIEGQLAGVFTNQGQLQAAVKDVLRDLHHPQRDSKFRRRPLGSFAEMCAEASPDESPVAPARAGAGEPEVHDPSLDVHCGSVSTNGMVPGTSDHKDNGLLDESGMPRSGAAPSKFVAPTLPLNWPAVLEVREAFAVNAEGDSMSDLFSRADSAIRAKASPRSLGEVDTSSRYAIDPNSRFHIIFGAISVIILVYDLTMLPYILAWSIEYEGFLVVTAWASPVFWSIDLVINFFTGFYSEGVLEMNLGRIRRHYLRSWFLIDFPVVVCDWTSVLLNELMDGSGSSRGLKMLRFSKLGRLLRILGMVRMLKAVRIMEEMAEMHMTDGTRLAFRMFTLFSCIMWVAHILACMWYAVGINGLSDTGARWIEQANVVVNGEIAEFEDLPFRYQYAVSFHWAAGQIALGALDVYPKNSLERAVFVLAMMVGFLFGSALVSMLSAAMMDYQMNQKDKTVKLRTLRTYLRENQVAPFLAVSVQKQVEQRLNQRKSLDEADVPALGLLSFSLRSELRFDIQKPSLMLHPMLRLWVNLDSNFMRALSMKAVDFVQLRAKDDLFSAGNKASAAYVIVSGSGRYIQEQDSAPVKERIETAVKPGEWFCEPSLWCEWLHVGKFEAQMSCTLLAINSEQLAEMLQKDILTMRLAREYCMQFHRRLISARPPHAPWPSDLQVPFTDYCDLVSSMAQDVQVIIGLDGLQQLVSDTWRAGRQSRAFEKLKEEVQDGKSVVAVTGDGNVLRVVSVVVFRIVRADGRIFVQVGKVKDGVAKPSCMLPGWKQEQGEMFVETMQRLFRTKLAFLADKAVVTGSSQMNTEVVSAEYGVMTRYLRSICEADFPVDEVLDLRVCEKAQSVAAPIPGKERRRSINAGGRSFAEPEPDEMLLASLDSVPVFSVSDGNASPLYAWLTETQFEDLSRPQGDITLKAWLNCLQTSASCPASEASDDAEEGDDWERGRWSDAALSI